MTKDKKTKNIIDLTSFRKSKALEEELAKGRTPLYLSHLKGRVTGNPHLNGTHTDGFGDRITRIRKSLERINALMTELKKMPEQHRSERRRARRK